MMPVIFKRFIGPKLLKNCSGHRVWREKVEIGPSQFLSDDFQQLCTSCLFLIAICYSSYMFSAFMLADRKQICAVCLLSFWLGSNYEEGRVGSPLISITQLHFCAWPKPGNGCLWQMSVCSVGIGEIVDHPCLNFLFNVSKS